MKTILILPKKHSEVDVITNSSTDIYIVDKIKTLGDVKDILRVMLDEYNKNSGFNYHFNGVFADIYVYEHKQEHKHNYIGFLGEEDNGRIIIEGCENSIPDELFEKISTTFNCSGLRI